MDLDDLVANNRRFAGTAARDGVPRIPFVPNKQLYILTCIDPRVDPADVFELALGDAIVARNVGGRVAPASRRAHRLRSRGLPRRRGDSHING